MKLNTKKVCCPSPSDAGSHEVLVPELKYFATKTSRLDLPPQRSHEVCTLCAQALCVVQK